MDLVEHLNKLGKEVKKAYPDINYGGCCVYAAIVVKELQKLNVPAQGIVASHAAEDDDVTIDEVRNIIQYNSVHDWQDNGINFSHVGVEFRVNKTVYHYDTSGAKKAKGLGTLDGMPVYQGRLTLREMEELAGTDSGWNSTFNRRCIPGLKRLVKASFQSVTI